jgi:hypothetical protein
MVLAWEAAPEMSGGRVATPFDDNSETVEVARDHVPPLDSDPMTVVDKDVALRCTLPCPGLVADKQDPPRAGEGHVIRALASEVIVRPPSLTEEEVTVRQARAALPRADAASQGDGPTEIASPFAASEDEVTKRKPEGMSAEFAELATTPRSPMREPAHVTPPAMKRSRRLLVLAAGAAAAGLGLGTLVLLYAGNSGPSDLAGKPVVGVPAARPSAYRAPVVVPPAPAQPRLSVATKEQPSLLATSGKRGNKPAEAQVAVTARREVGFLIVGSTSRAKIYVDGEDTGRLTPVASSNPLSLKPGRHEIVLEAGEEKSTFQVVIKPGETSRLMRMLPVPGGVANLKQQKKAAPSVEAGDEAAPKPKEARQPERKPPQKLGDRPPDDL